MVLGIVHVHDVEPVDTETFHAAFEAAQDVVAAERVPGLGAFGDLPADLGGQLEPGAVHGGQRPADASLGQAVAVQRSRVDQRGPAVDGGVHGGRGDVRIHLVVEIADRRAPEAEAGQGEPSAVGRGHRFEARHCSYSSLLSGLRG